MRRKADDLGMLTERMAASILQKIGTNAVNALEPLERLHVMYAVLDRCEDTGGRETSQ